MIYVEKSASSLLYCQHIQGGREMRKVMFFASTYLLYFAMGFVTLRFVYMWLMDESRLMEETVGKTAVLEKVAFFAPLMVTSPARGLPPFMTYRMKVLLKTLYDRSPAHAPAYGPPWPSPLPGQVLNIGGDRNPPGAPQNTDGWWRS